jgi:hypothetical protein
MFAELTPFPRFKLGKVGTTEDGRLTLATSTATSSEKSMVALAAVLRSPRRGFVCAFVGLVLVGVTAVWLDGRAAASVRGAAAAGASGSSWILSTSQFVNQFDTEPYVGNGWSSAGAAGRAAGRQWGA